MSLTTAADIILDRTASYALLDHEEDEFDIDEDEIISRRLTEDEYYKLGLSHKIKDRINDVFLLGCNGVAIKYVVVSFSQSGNDRHLINKGVFNALCDQDWGDNMVIGVHDPGGNELKVGFACVSDLEEHRKNKKHGIEIKRFKTDAVIIPHDYIGWDWINLKKDTSLKLALSKGDELKLKVGKKNTHIPQSKTRSTTSTLTELVTKTKTKTKCSNKLEKTTKRFHTFEDVLDYLEIPPDKNNYPVSANAHINTLKRDLPKFVSISGKIEVGIQIWNKKFFVRRK